jgi:hypothetical protein
MKAIKRIFLFLMISAVYAITYVLGDDIMEYLGLTMPKSRKLLQKKVRYWSFVF